MKAVGRWLRGGVLAGLLGLLSPAVWAAPNPLVCPASFPLQPPASEAQRQQALDELTGLDEICSTRADYFIWQGNLLLALQHPHQAAAALEKALMLDPDLAGAQLDYAQALAEMGENNSARDLVNTVLARPDIPSALHEWLTSQLGEAAGDAWKMSWMVQSLLGAETNLNSAPASNLLTLTLPGGSVPVVLGESQKPEAGMASLSTGAVEATRRWGPGQLTLSGDATLRASPAHADSNLQWVDGAALWTQPLWGGDAGARVAVTRLWMGGVELYDENAGKVFMEQPLVLWGAACRYGLGGDYSARSYPAAPTLDGRYSGLELGLGCQHGETLVTATGQWGVDRAQNPMRLGGDQARDDFSLAGSHPLGPGVLSLTGQWSRLEDQEAYSALLGGVPREILRRAGRVEYDYPLSHHWSALGYLEKTSQNSNIGLFALENQTAYMGLRWSAK